MATDKSPDKDKIEYRIEPKEGAPISLQKIAENCEIKPITMLVDGSGAGIVNDTPDFIDCTPKEREEQALHFISLNLPKLPEYMKKYLRIFYEKETDEQLEGLLKFGQHNDEFKQILGLIGMLAGIMSMARRFKKGVRVYIKHPETHLHPKRQSAIASFFTQVQEDFKWDDDKK